MMTTRKKKEKRRERPERKWACEEIPAGKVYRRLLLMLPVNFEIYDFTISPRGDKRAPVERKLCTGKLAVFGDWVLCWRAAGAEWPLIRIFRRWVLNICRNWVGTFFFRGKGIKEFKTLIKNKEFFVKIYTLQQFFFRNLYYLYFPPTRTTTLLPLRWMTNPSQTI